MSWLQSVMQGNVPGVTLTLIVLVLAIALVALFWIFRKIAGANHVKASRRHRPRLSVTDAAVVDDKRRLVLVRRDNIEHLVMIGGPTDIVIEQNIPAPAAPQIEMEAENSETGVEHRGADTAGAEPVEEEETIRAVPAKPAAPALERPAMERTPVERAIPQRPAAERPAFARPPHVQPGRPVEQPPKQRIERQPERQVESSARPEPSVTAERPENGDVFDKQFTSDLEAAFNEEQAATPTVSAESRYGAARGPMSPDVAPPASPARRRSENMEEEMQRLLDELSGSKPN